MRREGTDPQNVQMSDVLCDFCLRPWTEEVPMIEGHHGACVCARCLTAAYAGVVLAGLGSSGGGWKCPMCLEGPEDRAALGRAGEPGWVSPERPGAVMCRRCIEMAATALEKDPDFDWKKPRPRTGAT